MQESWLIEIHAIWSIKIYDSQSVNFYLTVTIIHVGQPKNMDLTLWFCVRSLNSFLEKKKSLFYTVFGWMEFRNNGKYKKKNGVKNWVFLCLEMGRK